MKKTIQPRILRTHQLITRGVAPQEGDAVALAAANTLQAIANNPAPPRRSVQELLSQASHTARAFTPRRPTMPAA